MCISKFASHIWMVNVYIQMYTEHLNGEILYPNLIWRVMSAKTFGWLI